MTFKRIWLNLILITFCCIVGNIFTVALFTFYNQSYVLPKTWITINLIITLIIGYQVIKRLKLNLKEILAAGFFSLIVFPILFFLFPFKMPQNYIGLRQTDKDGFIIAEEYCLRSCDKVNEKFNHGFKQERSFYSWRYAELLGRSPMDSYCCHNQPFDYDFLFGIALIMELTFEYFPEIILLTLLLISWEYIRKKENLIFGKDFVNYKRINVRNVIGFGTLLIIIICFYNLFYLLEIKNYYR